MKRVLFEDKDGNELNVYINSENQLYMSIGDSDTDDLVYHGYICLTTEDVIELIKELNTLLSEMS